MAKQTSKRRTQIKDLPKKKKELTKEEQKKVKGGKAGSPSNITDGTSNTFTDGSVRF